MANKGLFSSWFAKRDNTNTVNEAGGVAYAFDSKHALAQYAATGCMNDTYYADAATQLTRVLELCGEIEPEFIARTALYARARGNMKDLPALLVAVLASRGPGLMAEVFDRVIDSPKMLRNFVQMIRSGVTGRKSLGSLPKRMVVQWLAGRSDAAVFNASVGNDPSLADIIRMVHPKPATPAREALYAYLIGRAHDAEALPSIVREFEAWKTASDRSAMMPPDVPFQMLTALELSTADWTAIARRASWQTLRMNLNTFARHGVFENAQVVGEIAERLRDAKAIAEARVFPYQLMAAYKNASADMPLMITEALQDAMEVAIGNVPEISGQVYVFPDISGSMHSPITGVRKGSTSKVRCIDVAALVAAAMLRRNPRTVIVPFEAKAITPEMFRLNPRDTVMTNAQRLAALPAGGTNCSAPLEYLNGVGAKGDLVIYVSDNESWMDSPWHGAYGGSKTATMKQWRTFKYRNPAARMVCIDIQPYESTQAKEQSDITNVGGFSDEVFNLIAAVARGETSAGHWVREIEKVSL